jgi:hypothetical protein
MHLRKLSVAALSALVLAGCGSTTSTTPSTGSTGTTTASSGNTRAEFIAKADALCKTAHAKQGSVHGQASKKTTAPELVPLLTQQAKIAKGLTTSLRALSPPPGDTAAVGRFEHAVTELAVYSTALANSIHANHAYAARALAVKLTSWRQKETLLGQGYGYKVCANGTSY